MAEIPAPTLIGVKRIVISCDQVSGLSEGERQALCSELAKKAKAMTAYPVSVATSADLDPLSRARQSEQLLLRVNAAARTVDAHRKTIELSITPVRAGRIGTPIAPLKSSISFVKVQQDWMLQGQVDAFSKVLAGTRGLHNPIIAER